MPESQIPCRDTLGEAHVERRVERAARLKQRVIMKRVERRCLYDESDQCNEKKTPG